MSKYSIDYNKLTDQLLKRSYRLEDVKDRLETVAFDVVRFKDNDESSKLWQIQSADDGDYIVSIYEEPPEMKAEANPWAVSLSKNASSLSVYYKNDPIVTINAQQLGLPATEIKSVEKYLPAKLAENKQLVRALLTELNEPAKKMVFNKYPELQ